MAKDDNKKVAPYIPYKTFLTALDIVGQGPPPQLDSSVWATFSGGVRTQVLSAFKFLGLVDDEGNVQDSLERLLDGNQNRKTVLKQIIEQSYPEVVQLARDNASPQKLDDVMRGYGVSGETLEKAKRFYLQAAEDVGLPKSRLWKKARRTSTSRPRKKRKGSGIKDEEEKPQGQDEPSPPAEDLITVQLESGGTLTLGVTAAITKMSVEDRNFVFGLVDRIREYKDGQAETVPEEHTKSANNGGGAAVLESPVDRPEASDE